MTLAFRRFRLRKAPEHIDVKRLPRLQTCGRERRKRRLLVAVDRRPRSVHLVVKGGKTGQSAVTFPREAAAAFPFRPTHGPVDNGGCFTPAFAETCAALGAGHRHARPCMPQARGASRKPFEFRRGGAVCRCGRVERGPRPGRQRGAGHRR
jgi:hypothetical protein